MKKIKQYRSEVILITLIVLYLYFDIPRIIPYFAEIIISLWIIVILYSIFAVKRSFNNEGIYLTTRNDDAAKNTSRILGTFMLVFGTIYILTFEEELLLIILICILSALMIGTSFSKKKIKGLFIKVSNDKLIYDVYRTHNEIPLNEVNKIDIKSDQIIIDRENSKKNYISFLLLDQNQKKKAFDFLKKHLNSNTTILIEK